MPTIHVLADPPRSAPAIEGETVLANLLAAGVPFAHDCQAGNCGSCKCELVEGDVLELPSSPYALSDEDRAARLVLACRTQVWGDCVVRPLGTDEVAVHPDRIMRCRVQSLDELAHDIRRVRLSVEAGGPYTFSAGQYARVQLAPGLPERSYSMANRPDEQTLELHVRRVPGGQASEHLFGRLRTGDMVRVSGPLGGAFLRAGHRGPILAVAGGTGLAPLCSIVRTALQRDPGRRIHIYLGVRDERDVYLEDHLRTLAEGHPQLTVQVVLSAPGGSTQRRRGLVGDAVAADLPSLEGWKAYVAGPPPMVEHVQRVLTGRGLPGRDCHTDPFYSQAEADAQARSRL